MSFAGVEDIVKAAVANSGSGAAVTDLLFEKYGDRIDLIKEIAKAAIENPPQQMKGKVSEILLKVSKERDENQYKRFSWKMLSCAAAQNDNEACKMLLQSKRVDEDVKDIEGGSWTPLLYAIWRKDEAVIKALVDTGHINREKAERSASIVICRGNGA